MIMKKMKVVIIKWRMKNNENNKWIISEINEMKNEVMKMK